MLLGINTHLIADDYILGIYWQDNVLLHPRELDEEIDASANIVSHHTGDC